MAQALSTGCSSSSSPYSERGRPPKEICLDDVKYLLSLGISRTKVADILGISRQALYNRIKGCSNPEAFNRFSDLSDTELDSLISSIKETHPNDGEVMVVGHRSRGVRVPCIRLRASIELTLKAQLKERVLQSREEPIYHVSRPNEVWHTDGHHSLSDGDL